MKAQIVKIGNSRGLRIPKPILEECELSGEVELEVRADGLLIKPSKVPRLNWEESFKKIAENEDDEMIIENSGAPTSFEKEGWRW